MGKPSNHVRTVELIPEVRIEKPFVTMSKVDGDDFFNLVVPSVTTNFETTGPMLDGEYHDVRSFSKVKVGKPFLPVDKDGYYTEHDDETYNIISDQDRKLNGELQEALDEGKDLVLCPGIFFLSKTLIVRHPNQIILGLGLATLVAPQDGTPCIQVQPEVSGVRIAGLVLEASLQFPKPVKDTKCSFFCSSVSNCMTVDKPRCLLEIGEQNCYDPGKSGNPVLLADIFCRVGGSNLVRQNVETDVMIRIHSGNVVGMFSRIFVVIMN